MNWLKKLFGKEESEAQDAAASREKIPRQEAPPGSSSSELQQPATAPGDAGTQQHVVQLTPQEMALLEQHEKNPARLFKAAQEHLKEGRHDFAYQAFLILTKLAPGEITALRACGIALYSKDEAVWKKQPRGDLPHAHAKASLEYFDKVLTLDRNDHFSWYYRGFALAQIGHITKDKKRLKEGLDSFDEALRTRPGDVSTMQAKSQFEKAYLALGGTLPRSESSAQFKKKARQRAKDWWKQQSRTSGVCDVCNGPVTSAESYLLESKDVLRSEAYFVEFAHSPMAAMFGLSPDKAKEAQRAQVMADKTPWMICPKCIDMFE